MTLVVQSMEQNAIPYSRRREDRISDLADEIIHEILSLMPTKDAVRTSCLSKRWRHLWKFTPVIELSSPRTYHRPNPDCFLSRRLRRFIIVGKLYEWSEEVEDWLRFAISRKVRNLELRLFGEWPIQYLPNIPPCFYEYLPNVPPSFYVPENMAETVVMGCVYYSLPKGLFFQINNRLKKLFLYDCIVDQSDVESTVSNCMFLETLILVRCLGLTMFKISNQTLKDLIILPYEFGCGFKNLEINAPNLLSLTTKHLVVGLRLTNCCRLVRAFFQSTQLQGYNRGYNRSDLLVGFYVIIRQLLSQLHHLQILVANHWLTSFLEDSFYKNDERFPGFKNLKELCYLCHGIRGLEIPSWLNLLRDCPSLNKIQLDFVHNYGVGAEKVHDLQIHQEVLIRTRDELVRVEMYPDVECASRGDELKHFEPLKELKCIELFGFIGSSKQMEMVKRLLKRAPNLETLSLIYNRDSQHIHNVMKPKTRFMMPPEDRILLLEQVSQLPRVSPHVKLSLD